ncbi:unnamed protein product, partial [Chrysoparadoxa australica]
MVKLAAIPLFSLTCALGQQFARYTYEDFACTQLSQFLLQPELDAGECVAEDDPKCCTGKAIVSVEDTECVDKVREVCTNDLPYPVPANAESAGISLQFKKYTNEVCSDDELTGVSAEDAILGECTIAGTIGERIFCDLDTESLVQFLYQSTTCDDDPFAYGYSGSYLAGCIEDDDSTGYLSQRCFPTPANAGDFKRVNEDYADAACTEFTGTSLAPLFDDQCLEESVVACRQNAGQTTFSRQLCTNDPPFDVPAAGELKSNVTIQFKTFNDEECNDLASVDALTAEEWAATDDGLVLGECVSEGGRGLIYSCDTAEQAIVVRSYASASCAGDPETYTWLNEFQACTENSTPGASAGFERKRCLLPEDEAAGIKWVQYEYADADCTKLLRIFRSPPLDSSCIEESFLPCTLNEDIGTYRVTNCTQEPPFRPPVDGTATGFSVEVKTYEDAECRQSNGTSLLPAEAFSDRTGTMFGECIPPVPVGAVTQGGGLTYLCDISSEQIVLTEYETEDCTGGVAFYQLPAEFVTCTPNPAEGKDDFLLQRCFGGPAIAPTFTAEEPLLEEFTIEERVFSEFLCLQQVRKVEHDIEDIFQTFPGCIKVNDEGTLYSKAVCETAGDTDRYWLGYYADDKCDD